MGIFFLEQDTGLGFYYKWCMCTSFKGSYANAGVGNLKQNKLQ